ncbi:MAG: DUF58 domain-containing protein [Clostridiales bacterium]|jgi:uncharacterized protein (DUF58 family)|nr:DUF58 domain-containing protein [Clostridiales bacterium]
MGMVFMVIAASLFVALQNFLYSRFWKRGLTFDLSFSEKTVTEGASLLLNETIANAKPLPLPWLAVKFQLSRELANDSANSKISDDYYRNDLFSVSAYQRITRRLPFICMKRGYYTVKSIDLVCSNILHSQKLVAHIDCSAAVTVYPKLLPTDELPIPCKQILGETLARRFMQPDPFEFKSIREYQPYDGFKNVNFKATAKSGKLMVNVNDCTVSRHVLLMLNLQPYSSWVSFSLFEHAIRLAASISTEMAEEGVPLRFITNGLDIAASQPADIRSGSGSGHLANIYETLARIDLAKTAAPFAQELGCHAIAEETEPAYILISTYHEGDLREEFQRLLDMGASALWIIPAFDDMQVKAPQGESIVKWVVKEK